MSENRSIEGLQKLLDFNLRLIAGLRGPFLQMAVARTTAYAHRYAMQITHVDTGALRASHRMEVSAREGLVFLDPEAYHPDSLELTSVYGFFEHERGGDHAFYQRTADERGHALGMEGVNILMESIRNA